MERHAAALDVDLDALAAEYICTRPASSIPIHTCAVLATARRSSGCLR
jgi:hypothetical protein